MDDDEFDEGTSDFHFKYILVGSSMVGKTSLINRYVEDTFNEDEKRSRQVQVNHKMFSIPDTKKVVDLHIWDTLGQEKFQSIAKIFYRGTVGAFLVFDLSKRSSFEDIESWLNITNDSTDNTVVKTLIGNKCDIPSREVKYDEAMAYAQSKGMNYLEVSAKTGQNVVSIFSIMTTEVYKRMNNKGNDRDANNNGGNSTSVLQNQKKKKKGGCCGGKKK